MPDDDKAAREARATKLHKLIDELVAPPEPPDEAAEKKTKSAKESPRDFIHRKMKELDKDNPVDKPSE